MVKPGTPRLPNYLPQVLALGAELPPGQVHDVFVFHDDDCRLLAGSGPCNCTPAVTHGFVLWFRPRRRAAWQRLVAAPTESECWAAIPTTGKRNGDWLVLPGGQKP
jgi:hypothetical protein